MAKDFVKIDLHIHTPASSCYRGKNDDDEYIKIVERAAKHSLRIISLTDHNSIEGYRRLMQIRQTLIEQSKALMDVKESSLAKTKLSSIQGKLALFDRVLILPGVEFEVNNGIHLLVLFNNSYPVESIERFLMDGGYDKESYGKENPTGLSRWDILDLLTESKKHDCIVIDAHTDSDKGILNTVPSGTLRASCFRSSQLVAVAYNNERQKDQLQSTIQTSKEYSRSTPMSFVRFSDAHCLEDIGKKYTWIRFDKPTFEELKLAFSNPSERVSIEDPSLERILERLIKDKDSHGILDISASSLERFEKILCALSNSSGGYVLFGVSEKNNKIGLAMPAEDVKYKARLREIEETIISSIEKVEIKIIPRIIEYPLQNQNVIVSIQVPKSRAIATLKGDGRVYYIKSGSLKVLNGSEIQAVIAERTEGEVASMVAKRIARINKDCQFVESYFHSLPIIHRYEQMSCEHKLSLEISKSIKVSDAELKKMKSGFSNGRCKGNLYYHAESMPPRYQHAYLRYSLPLENLRRKGLVTTNTPTLYLVPGGGVFYSPRDYSYLSEGELPVLKLQTTKENPYSLKFITAFFKSSFFLWYCSNRFDSVDIHRPELYNEISIPLLSVSDSKSDAALKSVDHNFDMILKAEYIFLKEGAKLIKTKHKEYHDLIDKHNRHVDKLAYEIDTLIYKLLGLSNSDVEIIEAGLKLQDIFIPDIALFNQSRQSKLKQ